MRTIKDVSKREEDRKGIKRRIQPILSAEFRTVWAVAAAGGVVCATTMGPEGGSMGGKSRRETMSSPSE